MLSLIVTYEGKNKKLSVEKGTSIESVLKKMNINPETVIVGVDNVIVPESTKLQKAAHLTLIKVISGG